MVGDSRHVLLKDRLGLLVVQQVAQGTLDRKRHGIPLE
jgi:hypothetical protein